jgi:collagen type VII alpha
MTREIAFIDPGVDHLGELLAGLRDGVKAVVLSVAMPVHEQMSVILAGRRELQAVHVIAHGEPGCVRFAAGDWTRDMLLSTEGFASIGEALAQDGELRLWSCRVSAGQAGEDFVDLLASRIGAAVVSAPELVGSAALGGTWGLARHDGMGWAPPPLTAEAMRVYPGILAMELKVSGTLPTGPTTSTVTYYIVNQDLQQIVGQVLLPDASDVFKGVDMAVRVPPGTGPYAIGTFDKDGKFQPVEFLKVTGPGASGPATGARGL